MGIGFDERWGQVLACWRTLLLDEVIENGREVRAISP